MPKRVKPKSRAKSASRRRYSAADIDKMRRKLDDAHPTYYNGFGMRMGPGPEGIERMLQTYIKAGVRPEEVGRG